MHYLTSQKRQFYFPFFVVVFYVAVTMVNTAYADSGASDNGQKFNAHSLQGAYGFALDGLALNVFDGSTINAAAVGRFTFDGKGHIANGVRTLNTAGTVQKENFSGTYTVNQDGTGVLTIHVSTILPDGTAIPTTIETAEFVINQPRNEMQLIGTNITGPNGEDLGLRLVTRGVARQQ